MAGGQIVSAITEAVFDVSPHIFGAMYFYIQDVIIHPEHQNKGLGSKIMNTLIAHLESCCAPGATIGLLAAHGKESFYLKFGFKPRDGQSLGLGMCRFI